ncbi:MAG: helix-turn-helix transcriptional regulator [Blautia sp.]|nr:helix-turn-helix transcriptional regulator [Blautia sp.]
MDYQKEYLLQKYLFSGEGDSPEELSAALRDEFGECWHSAILLDVYQPVMDKKSSEFKEEIRKVLPKEFDYLNINIHQSLLLFKDEGVDYKLIANHIYVYLKRLYTERLHFAVSDPIESWETLPAAMRQLEQLIDEKYYHPDEHVYISNPEAELKLNTETLDSYFVQRISEDISRKDMSRLWYHYHCLTQKYEEMSRFSAMYVKFVFSNVIQELYSENEFVGLRTPGEEIERLYHCEKMDQILAVTEENIRQYEAFLNKSVEASTEKVLEIKKYISEHYGEDLTREDFSREFSIAPGFLGFVFRKTTGMSVGRYLRVMRMEKARELLEKGVSLPDICHAVGYKDETYLLNSVHVFWGDEVYNELVKEN